MGNSRVTREPQSSASLTNQSREGFERLPEIYCRTVFGVTPIRFAASPIVRPPRKRTDSKSLPMARSSHTTGVMEEDRERTGEELEGKTNGGSEGSEGSLEGAPGIIGGGYHPGRGAVKRYQLTFRYLPF